jgi:hypothetical protein
MQGQVFEVSILRIYLVPLAEFMEKVNGNEADLATFI